MKRRVFGLASVLLLACCGGAEPGISPVPSRNPTGGDELLRAVPRGADLVLEIDLRRMRANPVLGPLMASIAPPVALGGGDLLQGARLALVCVYDIGDASEQLIVLESDAPSHEGATRLRLGHLVVGSPGLVARAESVAASATDDDSMASDREFMRLRAKSMPQKADGATLRLAATLDFDAQVALASEVNVSEVPASISAWGDVVDDLAIVVYLGASDGDSTRLERAILALRSRLVKTAQARQLGLAKPLQAARLARSEGDIGVVFLLKPRRLQYVADRILRQLTRTTE